MFHLYLLQLTYTLKYDDLKDEKCEGLVAKVAFIPEITKETEEKEGFEVVAQPIVAQPEFELATTTARVVDEETGKTEIVSSYNQGDEVEITYSLASMTNVGEAGIEKIKGTLLYDRQNFEYVDGSIKAGSGWQEFSASQVVAGKLNISGKDISSVKSDQIGEVFKLRFRVLKDINSVETLIFSNVRGGDGDGEEVPVCADVTTSIQIAKKVSQVEDKVEARPGSLCDVKDGIVFGVIPGSTVNDLAKELSANDGKLITYYGTKLATDENGNIYEENLGISKTASKLTGEDLLSTGASVKVGEKSYPIVISGDVDGDGDFDMTDLALSMASYRETEVLTGFYKKASDVDENGEFDMTDVAEMLNYYRGLQESPKPNAE